MKPESERGKYLSGFPVRSIAGHDKNQVFFILKEEGEYVYLVDGKIRTLDHPKKKKKKHVEPLNWAAPADPLLIQQELLKTNEAIKYRIRCFRRQ